MDDDVSQLTDLPEPAIYRHIPVAKRDGILASGVLGPRLHTVGGSEHPSRRDERTPAIVFVVIGDAGLPSELALLSTLAVDNLLTQVRQAIRPFHAAIVRTCGNLDQCKRRLILQFGRLVDPKVNLIMLRTRLVQSAIEGQNALNRSSRPRGVAKNKVSVQIRCLLCQPWHVDEGRACLLCNVMLCGTNFEADERRKLLVSACPGYDTRRN
mmetsp:Transcript_65051/g.172272  ORF Transcript_65051/g.172272 Transcript_65051/m.172272 type:complete len:211 (-) Transcript_65051:1590-2222(-)